MGLKQNSKPEDDRWELPSQPGQPPPLGLLASLDFFLYLCLRSKQYQLGLGFLMAPAVGREPPGGSFFTSSHEPEP